jgi:predicted Zn-dependent protease
MQAARAARRAGRYPDAERHLRACRRLQGPSDARLLEDALLTAQRGNLAGVERYLLSFRPDHADAPLILEVLVPAYLEARRRPEALRGMVQLLRPQPDHAPALVWRGRVKEQFFDSPPQAIEDYRRALELDPDNDEARLRLAEVLVAADEAAEALPHFERLRERQPWNPPVFLGLARCRHAAGQLDEAEELLEAVLSRYPQDAPALTERGQLALEQGRTAEAERWLRQALAVAPANPLANYALAQCLQRDGRLNEAEKYLKTFRRIEADVRRLKQLVPQVLRAPHDPALRYEVGMIFLNNHRTEDGLAWLAGALREDPRHRPTHRALAEHYERAGNAALAARHRGLAIPGERGASAP